MMVEVELKHRTPAAEPEPPKFASLPVTRRVGAAAGPGRPGYRRRARPSRSAGTGMPVTARPRIKSSHRVSALPFQVYLADSELLVLVTEPENLAAELLVLLVR